MNDIVIFVVLGLCVISVVIALVSLVLVVNVLKKQKELIKIYKTRPAESPASSAQVKTNKDVAAQLSNPEAKKHGIIICKKCYAAISETSVACAVCKMPVGRR